MSTLKAFILNLHVVFCINVKYSIKQTIFCPFYPFSKIFFILSAADTLLRIQGTRRSPLTVRCSVCPAFPEFTVLLPPITYIKIYIILFKLHSRTAHPAEFQNSPQMIIQKFSLSYLPDQSDFLSDIDRFRNS